MNALNIIATKSTPAISYNAEHAWFRVVGNSIPENASAFYAPLVNWLQDHGDQLPNGCAFEFSLPYFNSSSLKALYQVLMQIKRLQELGKQLSVTWYVEEDDDFMLEAGETYREMVSMDIEIKAGHIEV
ncbi:MAG: DUF1987 domain-containing protein [Flavobacteriales bacterium]|jgi:hypothetical protein|nr:DUF1987 domain-containing protein [Flavobacteriales bacterium]MBK9513837.1 DUF1987 domain-containing protein [Flavobacteriales bacterium]HOZ41246.1 DUF1987 domain-containing protein [Flavobacteriales bacterium]